MREAKKAVKRGLFITFEGIDGCGKSTQASILYKRLQEQGYRVKLLREPGSTRTAERIRKILLDKRLSVSPRAELLLYEAARAELTTSEIQPLIKDGWIVLCDRFYDSTTAYQGYGRQLDIRMVRSLHKVAVGDLVPDLTLVFDVDLATAATRRKATADRLESAGDAFFSRVRKGFLEIARKERRRVKVIPADRSVDDLASEVNKLVGRKLKGYGRTR